MATPKWIPEEEPTHLTPEGLEKLKNKLARWQADLPALAVEAQRTAAYGDRSENFEYKIAKRDFRRAQGQIIRITAQLKNIAVIPKGPDASGAVRRGTTVTLETDEGDKKIYYIVGPRETDPAHGKISAESPLGVALIGKKLGNRVTISTPRGTMGYTILEVK